MCCYFLLERFVVSQLTLWGEENIFGPRKVKASLLCGTLPFGIMIIKNLQSLHYVLRCAADVVVFLCTL